MIVQFLELLPEYTDCCNSHPQIECLLPSNYEIVMLTHLSNVLRPFKEHTLRAPEAMPSLARILEIYWDLDDFLERVISGEGLYSKLDQPIRDAFKAGKLKHVKYIKKLEKNSMLYTAHIRNPRCKTSMIKDMMTDKAERVITAAKKYFEEEWPEAVFTGTPSISSQPLAALPATRPANMSVARWKAIQTRGHKTLL
jgi:hypothetical protein